MMNGTKQANPEDVEVLQVHTARPDDEFEVVAACETETSARNAKANARRRELCLTRGGEIEMPGEEAGYGEDPPFAYQHPEHEPVKRTVTPREEVAIGYYLHLLEMNGFDQQAVREELFVDSTLETYHTFRDGLTEVERKHRLIDLLEWRVNVGNPVMEPYLKEKPCSWRSTELSGESRDVAERIVNAIDREPGICYLTARRAALLHSENHRLAPRVEYVEGVALPNSGAQAIRHAWIEVDGQVVECTWPWHDLDGGDAVYRESRQSASGLDPEGECRHDITQI